MGVSKPTIARSFVTVVQCAGQLGVSTGVLKKTRMLGMLGYCGSTVPGMSGAAYTSAGQLVGMHLGSMLAINTGVSIAVLMEELTCIVRPEGAGVMYDSFGQGEEAAKVAGVERRATWTTKDVKLVLKKRYTEEPDVLEGENWADHMDEFYEEESRKVPKVRFDLEMPMSAVKVTPHTGRGKEYSVEYASADLLARVEALEEQVKSLNEQVNRRPKEKAKDEALKCATCGVYCANEERFRNHMEQSHRAPKTKESHPCEYCKVVCTTRERLQRHQEFSCSGVERPVPESASPADFRKNVKQSSFLGSRPNSGRRNSRSSSSSSTLENVSPHYQRLEENQNQMLECLKLIADSLRKQPLGMAGPSSVKTPN